MTLSVHFSATDWGQSMTATNKNARLNVRLTISDDEMIREAAEAAGETVSDFLTRAAVERAHEVLADQRTFTLDEQEWDEFLRWLDKPATPDEQLVELFARPRRIAR